MILKTISTGSAGNSYTLTASDGEIFLIELGVSERIIKQEIDFQVSKIAGVFCSHVHIDHSKALPRFYEMGVQILNPYQNGILKGEYGRFKAKCFPLVHDVDCYGLYLEHEEMGNLVYVSDTSYCPVDFQKQKLNHIIIEVNWQDGMVDFESPNFEHKIRHHMSLNTCKEFIRHNNSPNLRNIVLVHYNEFTVNLDQAVKEIAELVDSDVNISIAYPGYELELKKEIF